MASFQLKSMLIAISCLTITGCGVSPVGKLFASPRAEGKPEQLVTSLAGYFVSPQGADDHPGTLNQPFKTIQQCAEVARPGDTCWLRGGTYRETVIPPSSGKPGQPIVFAAFRDEVVTISGTEAVSDWSAYQEQIYRTQIKLPVASYSDTGFLANQLFVNRRMMPEARVPNLSQERDYFQPEMFGGGLSSPQGTNATIDHDEIPQLTNGWAGAQVWTNEWYATRTGTITGEIDGQLTAEMTAEWQRGGFWFYLFGKLELLDDPGEWFYDAPAQQLYLWAPHGHQPTQVEVKQRNYAFDLSDRSHIQIRGVNLFANTITTGDRSRGIVIDGIKAHYISHHMTLPPIPPELKAAEADGALFLAAHAHDTGIQLRGKGHVLRNSIIDGSSGNGILLEGSQHLVSNNIILNTNYKSSYAAPIRLNGNGHRITHNTIKRTGRDGISWDWHTAGTDGRNLEIAYNDISEFGLLNTDLGAVYICCHVDLAGGSIHHNWIHDAQAFSPFWGTRGIYLDLETFNSTIHHNVVWNLTGSKDNYNLVAGSPRGYERIFHNTFWGDVDLDPEFIEARNNIFAGSPPFSGAAIAHNLFQNTPLAVAPPNLPPSPDFPGVNQGQEIPAFTSESSGGAPDLGAYEQGLPPWRAGSSLQYDPYAN